MFENDHDFAGSNIPNIERTVCLFDETVILGIHASAQKHAPLAAGKRIGILRLHNLSPFF